MSVDISRSLERWFLSRVTCRGASVNSDDCLKYLTVIVPSYCRQPYLLRQVIYWMNSAAKVILLDGSPEPLPRHLTFALEGISNVRYCHSPIGMVERLTAVKFMIDTPYSVLLGDDEFHLQGGLRQAVLHLQVHRNDVGCIGQSLKFFVSQDKDRTRIAYGSGYAHFGYSVQAEGVLDRFSDAIERYNAATCYAVLRTEVWKDSWGTLLKTSCKDVCEVQQALGTYSAGKFATVDKIYWLLSYENTSVSDHNHFKILNYQCWWKKPAYADERQSVVASIAAIMQKYNNFSREYAESVAGQGLDLFDRFLGPSYPPRSLLNRARMKGALVSGLRRVMPSRMYKALRNYLVSVAKPDLFQGADIGTLEALAWPELTMLFRFDAETGMELAAVENLIIDFHRNM